MKCFFCEQKDGNTNPGKTQEFRKRNWMGPGTDKSNWKNHRIFHGRGQMELEKYKALAVTREGKNWTGDTQVA